MKQERRLLAAILSALLLASATGCNDQVSEESGQSDSTSSSAVESSGAVSSSDETQANQTTDTVTGTNAFTTGSTSETTKKTGSSGSAAGTSSSSSAPATKPSVPSVNYTCKASDYIPNVDLWKTPGITEKGQQFQFEIQAIYTSRYAGSLWKTSVSKQKLGDTLSLLPSQRAEEWGYSITHLDGKTDGSGRKIVTNFSGKNAPTSRYEAVQKLGSFIYRQYNIDDSQSWYSMNGHYLWHHYAGEFGADVIGSEIGEAISNYQMHIAFNRGAARQYQTPWSIDFSDWWLGSIYDPHLEVGNSAIWPGNSNVNGGHSLNLLERSLVMSYMSGADSVVAEAGLPLSLYPELGSDGNYRLTEYGKTCQKINRFITSNSDIGVTYTPIAIVLDYYHGMYSGLSGEPKKAFYNFDYNAGDNMSWELMNMIWPDGWNVHKNRNEVGAMVNGPYGDNFDVLLQNASQKVLNSYPALLLSGDINLSTKEVARYIEYVKQGGTLILNTAYQKKYPEFTKSMNYGNGKVIVYGPDYSVSGLGSIIKDVLNDTLQFTVSDNVEYFTNIKDGSMYVTLINNNGVTKTSTGKTQTDASRKVSAVVQYKGNLPIKSVKEVYDGTSISVSGKKTTVSVPAGGIVILEYRFD